MTLNADTKPRLLFCPAWFPNRINAASGSFNMPIARGLATYFDVAVLYVHVHEFDGIGTLIEQEEAGGVRILRYYVHRSIRFGPGFPRLYNARFNEGLRLLYDGRPGPDLAYVRGILPGGLAVQALHRRTGLPYVTNESFSGFPDLMRSRVKRWWVGRILRDAARTAGVSSYQCEVMGRIFPDIKFDVVTNVIEEAPAAGRDPGDPGHELRMIYVGNLVPVKGWDLLLEGLRLYLDGGGASWRLTIVGGGADEEAARAKAAELKLESHVGFLGRRPHEEAKALMSAHHFLVLPSRIDTCPNVVLEAFMEGRPVLATKSGGAQDLVREGTGRLVEKESPRAIAEGIEWMSRNIGSFDAAAIRRHVVENHSVGTLARYLMGALPETTRRGNQMLIRSGDWAG